MSEDRAGRLVEFIAEDLRGTVVDIGCGWAELLLRVVAAVPGCTGVGLDLDAGALAHGRHLADRRGLTERVSLVQADAEDAGPGLANAVICIGASQVWADPTDHSAPIGYSAALRAIRVAPAWSTARRCGHHRRPTRQRDGYFRGYRGVMGLAYLHLLAV